MNLDELKTALCKGEYSHLSIQWNDDIGANYSTAAEIIAENAHDYYDDESFISPEEKQKCIETNSIWTAHWYPDTPIGSYHLHASTFEALLKALEQEATNDI